MQPHFAFTRYVLLFFTLISSIPVLAQSGLPQGHVVADGAAEITTSGTAMQIDQSTHRAIINWDSFSVAIGHEVNIQQPATTSALLARVTGTETSQIFGSVHANGGFYLVNPHGIVIGETGEISADRAILSTYNIDDTDFMTGQVSMSGSSTAEIVNDGTITARLISIFAHQIRQNSPLTASDIGFFAGGNASHFVDNAAGGSVSFAFSGAASHESEIQIGEHAILTADTINISSRGTILFNAMPGGSDVVTIGDIDGDAGTIVFDGVDDLSANIEIGGGVTLNGDVGDAGNIDIGDGTQGGVETVGVVIDNISDGSINITGGVIRVAEGGHTGTGGDTTSGGTTISITTQATNIVRLDTVPIRPDGIKMTRPSAIALTGSPITITNGNALVGGASTPAISLTPSGIPSPIGPGANEPVRFTFQP